MNEFVDHLNTPNVLCLELLAEMNHALPDIGITWGENFQQQAFEKNCAHMGKMTGLTSGPFHWQPMLRTCC